MKISNLLLALLIAIQVSNVVATFGFGFDVNKANAFLNAGDCYFNPGLSTSRVQSSSSSSSKGTIGLKYYDLPYGWRQYRDRVVVPKVLSQKGDWVFGAKVADGSDSTKSVNEQFKVSINGLDLKISPVTASVSKNIVIGSNYRSEGVSDDDWDDFIKELSDDNRKYSGKDSSDNDDYFYWDWDSRTGLRPSTRNTQVKVRDGKGSSSSQTVVITTTTGSSSSSSGSSSSGSSSGPKIVVRRESRDDFQNLVSKSGDDDDIMTSIILGHTTPSQVFNTVRTTTTSSSSTDARRIALENQLQANRVLNELTSLVAQLNGNVDTTTLIVAKLESEISSVKTNSSQCNDKILELSAAKVKAEAAINTINERVKEYKTKLNDFTPALNSLLDKRSQLVQTRITFEKSKTPNSFLLSQLESKYTTCNAQVDSAKGDYAKIKASIDSNTQKITTIEKGVTEAPKQISLAKEQIKVVDVTIAELEAKLSEARGQRSKLQVDINGYNDLVRTSSIQISTLRNQNSKLTSQLSGLQASVDSQVVKCSTYQKQSDEIRAEIAGKQKDYDALVKQIEVQESLIANKKSEIERFQSETSALPSQINTLQSQLLSAQTALSRQYFICSQSTNSVTKADNDLRAAKLRLETEKKFLSDAQTRLTAAKTAKANADDAVTKILTTVVTTTTTGGSTTVTGGSTTVTGGSTTVTGGSTTTGSSTTTSGSTTTTGGSIVVGGSTVTEGSTTTTTTTGSTTTSGSVYGVIIGGGSGSTSGSVSGSTGGSVSGGSTGGVTIITTGSGSTGSGSTGGSITLGGGSETGSIVVTGGSGSGSSLGGILGGISGVAGGSVTGGSVSGGSIGGGLISGGSSILTGSTVPSNVLVYGVGPVAVGSISDYINRVYGSTVSAFWDPWAASSASTYSTMYPVSPTTLSALYGQSSAGVFLPSGSSYLAGISESLIGSSALPSNIIGDFSCSGSSFGALSSDLVSGFGKITSVQPGYITVSTPANDSYNLRIGGCSRLEATRPEFVASTLDPVFFRGKRSLSGDIHLYDLTCLS